MVGVARNAGRVKGDNRVNAPLLHVDVDDLRDALLRVPEGERQGTHRRPVDVGTIPKSCHVISLAARGAVDDGGLDAEALSGSTQLFDTPRSLALA
jgi:hypothetical protein